MATNTLSLLSRSSHNARWPFSPRTDVGFSEHTSQQALTGSWIVGIDGSILSPSQFQLVSGPCTLSNDGKCVGRPQGYTEGESCNITVATGGALAACPMFQVRPQPSSFLFSVLKCVIIFRADGGLYCFPWQHKLPWWLSNAARRGHNARTRHTILRRSWWPSGYALWTSTKYWRVQWLSTNRDVARQWRDDRLVCWS
jgi:hypothetical protein